MDIKNYNLNTPEEELVEIASQIEDKMSEATSEQKALYLSYILGCLNVKYQKKLLNQQNRFNTKLIENNKKLVIATWALAGTTILFAIITAIINIGF